MSALPPPVDTSRPAMPSPTSSDTLAAEEHDGHPSPLEKPMANKANASDMEAGLAHPPRSPGRKTDRPRGFSDLPPPSRNITAPAATGRLIRALSGDYNVQDPDLLELKQRRALSGLFHLNVRDDLQHAHTHVPSVHEKEKAEGPDPNVIVFEGDDDPLSAQNWSTLAKISQTVLLGISTLVVTFASSVFSSATSVVAVEFGIGSVTATLGTSLFVLGYAVGPLIWGPASEFLGRKNPLVFSYFVFATFNLPVALASNFYTIAICRFIGGTAASGPLAIVAGALSDFWSAEARGGATAIFALATFAGPAVGPIVGSFVTQSYLGWRWTAWLTAIWSYTMLIIMVFFMRESFAPILLQRKAKRIRYETKNWSVRGKLDERQFDAKEIVTVYMLRPIKMLIVEPILLFLTMYTAFIYGILYLLFGAVPLEFRGARGWSLGVASLPFAAVFLGSVAGCGVVWAFTPRYVRIMHARKAIAVPEERALPMMIGAIVFPIGIFLYGWTTSEYCGSWVPSVIGLGFVGMGVVLIFLQAINIIVDVYLFLANSAIAGNTFLRSFFGAGFPLFTAAMFNNLGQQWASTLIGCLALVALPFPFVFYKYGHVLRKKSKFAPKL